MRMGDEKLLLIPLLKKTIMSMAENQFLKGK